MTDSLRTEGLVQFHRDLGLKGKPSKINISKDAQGWGRGKTNSVAISGWVGMILENFMDGRVAFTFT